MTARLGLDLGERRIGVAIAADGDRSARPLTTVPRGRTPHDDARRLTELIERHRITELVVGLPLEAAGQEGGQAALTRAWVDAIRPAIDPRVAIVFRDERWSSHLAETRLGPMPRGRSGGPPTRAQREAYRARVDREAAAIVLQDVLDTRDADGSSTIEPQTTMETPT